MTKRKRRNHSPGFKAKVVLAAMRGARTLGFGYDPRAGRKGG